MCCGDDVGKEIDFQKLRYDPIEIKIEKSKLRFFEQEGVFKLVSGGGNENSEVVQDYIKRINDAKNEINQKNDRINDLKNKLEEIDNKLAAMNKILSIDISEKEYIIELGKRIQAQSKPI